MTTQSRVAAALKPSERIRELAEDGEAHPFFLGNGTKIDAVIAYLDEQAALVDQERAAQADIAVTCGACGVRFSGWDHTCKAKDSLSPPTTLAELRVVDGATGENAETLCSECGRSRLDPKAGCHAHQRNAEAYGWENDCQAATIFRLKARVALLEGLGEEHGASRVQSQNLLLAAQAERDTLTARVADLEAERDAERLANGAHANDLVNIAAKHKQGLDREQAAHEATKRKLTEAQQAVIEISGHLSRARAALAAVGKLVASADIPLPLFNEFEAALSALDKPAVDSRRWCSGCGDKFEGATCPVCVKPAAAKELALEVELSCQCGHRASLHDNSFGQCKKCPCNWVRATVVTNGSGT